MAGDWIPMRLDLSDDPAVILIADKCNLDEHSVIGRLYKLWAWANRHLKDGNGTGVTESWVDRYAGVSGFASAMIEAGWLATQDGFIMFPNFERWNSKGAKNRILGTERVKKHRTNVDTVTGNQNCNDATVTGPLPEKSREENNTISEKPPKNKTTKHDPNADGSPWNSTAAPIPWPEGEANHGLAHNWLATRLQNGKFITNGQARSAFEQIERAHLDAVQIGEVFIAAKDDKTSTVSKYLPATPHSLLCDAIAEVTGGSLGINGGEIGALAKALLEEEPPFYAADIREFDRRATSLLPEFFRDGKRKLKTYEIKKYINLIRTQPEKPKIDPYEVPRHSIGLPSPEQIKALADNDHVLKRFMAKRGQA